MYKTTSTYKPLSYVSGIWLLFAAGIILLAYHPVNWLVRTWFDPSYQSQGLLVMALVTGFCLWSITSPRIHVDDLSGRRAVLLLCLTALVRLAGQLLGVNVIGAVALVLDAYALSLLFGLHQRRRPLAPGWLAILFAFSLPLERIIQRTIGFFLQQVSAAGACQVLSLGADPVRCEGIRILLAGQDVLVDLPCSGARTLMLLLLLFVALATLTRPAIGRALVGLSLTLVAAMAANVLRIVILALGVAYPQYFGGISVMEAPWHEAIGFAALVLGAIPILVWASRVPASANQTHTGATRDLAGGTRRLRGRHRGRAASVGILFLVCAAVIVSLPPRPVDVARRIAPFNLPGYISGYSAVRYELSARERAYFVRYGGSAARAAYGPNGLLVVTTSAPLRHLHAPDECLTGAGHRVRYLGMSHQTVPTAIYRSTDPAGRVWRVAVTFVSDQGDLATSVTEAVWRWLQNPDTTWSMVQRISPWGSPHSSHMAWDTAVFRAMDLSYSVANPMTRQSSHPTIEEI